MIGATLAAQPLAVLGRNVVFPPDPVGMRSYQQHHLVEMIALVVVVLMVLLGCLRWFMQRQASTSEHDWFYEI